MSLQNLFPIEKWNFKTSTVLRSLPPEERAMLLEHQIIQVYEKGEFLFREGMPPVGIFIIVEGKVKKFKTDQHGKEQIIYVGGAGELVGYHAVLANERYPDSASVLEKSTLSFIPRDAFLAAVDRSGTLSKCLLQTLSHEFTVFVNNLSALTQKSVRERLALQLIILREKYKVDFQPGMPVTIDISREDLAALVGTAREHVIRLLSELKEKKIIETRGSKIILKDVQALLQIANQ